MHPPSILIIEDEPALLRGLRDNFESQGYLVQIARDGQEGLSAALANPPDLLLLDIMLPKMNGYEICRALRARQLEMPIIMLTAKGQEEDIVRGLELGADDYVTKPFSIRELLARAKAFLRRRQSASCPVFQFGDCKLDLLAHKVFRNGKEIFLTTKEFRLLEFFVRRPGRALTRDQILDGVWGNEIIVNDRSVDRCVTTLRAKIEPDPHHPVCIQTIRDIGYRFSCEEKLKAKC
jgi:DNA-binding response OmpR family regulator